MTRQASTSPTSKLDTTQLGNALVRTAVIAMNAGDRDAWFAAFAPNATLTDDGHRQDFRQWSEDEIFGEGRGHLISIERQEDNGLTLFGHFNSAQWGSFNTVFRFRQQGNTLTGLDVAQLSD